MLSRTEVELAYRLILGREPESDAVIDGHRRNANSLVELREAFLNSAEFRSHRGSNGSEVPSLPTKIDHGPPMAVEIDLDPTMLQKVWERVEQCWQALGQTEPYWSVASCDQFKSRVFEAHEAEFYATGNVDVMRLLAWLARNHVDVNKLSSCVEYGCGVGRVTAWLSTHFTKVYGYDISPAHLKLAQESLQNKGRLNVVLERLETISALSRLPRVDLIFTVIVLQHNPPPVIAYILRSLLRSLNPRGIAFFQVPTYALGYVFDSRQYLQSASSTTSFEMHLLPQSSIYEIVHDEGCIVREVQPDYYVGDPNWVSNTFLVQKR
jgi:SAM-dependent methyltransferase